MLSIDEINLLQAQNEGLKKQNAELQKENAELKAYKDVNEDFKTAWEELKAESELLKEDYIKLYQQKDLDNAKWQKRCTDLHIEDKAKVDKYWLILQEIKAIAEKEIYMKQNSSMDRILDLITKTEEE